MGATGKDRAAIEALQDELIRAAFPLYGCKELKDLLKTRFYLFVQELREAGVPQNQIADWAGVSEETLRAWGGVSTPRPERSRVPWRVVLALLQASPSDGLGFDALWRRFRDLRPDATVSDLNQALGRLLDAEAITWTEQCRYRVTSPHWSLAADEEGLTDALLNATRAVRRLRGREAGWASITSCTLQLPKDQELRAAMVSEIKSQLRAWSEASEASALASGEPTEPVDLFHSLTPS